MEFEELNDMAVIAVQRNGEIGESSMKLMRNLKNSRNVKDEIIKNIIFLMFLAEQYKINLEDALLNKIEEMNKNGS